MVDIKFYSSLKSKPKSDLIIYPFLKKNSLPIPCSENIYENPNISSAIEYGDFTAALGELRIFYDIDAKDKRIGILGLGEEEILSVELLRRAYAIVIKECQRLKVKTLSIVFPFLESPSSDLVSQALAESLFLTNYSYSRSSKNESIKIESIFIIGAPKTSSEIFNESFSVAQGVHLCRDLVNESSHIMTPSRLSQIAIDMAEAKGNLKVDIFRKKRLQKEKMGLILAVSEGSTEEPAMIFLEYKGNPKSKDHTVLVGKGVTYDTGGINLKPTGSLETMRCDMAGGAAVLGIMEVLSTLKLKINVTGIIPATENSIDANSFKPGDVYTGYAGKSVEIGNTDAEGRLILADALSYAAKNLKPSRIIDFATLTGAMVISLGNVVTGFMSNNKDLSDQLIQSGEETYERLWRLPLFEEYKKQLKSDIADLKNIGGRAAGSITAALFLEEFIENIPWAHLDIAGTAFFEKDEAYIPKNGTGVGVRLIINFLKNLIKVPS